MFEPTAQTFQDRLDANLLRRVTLGDTLYRSARRCGDRTALVAGSQRVSYATLDTDSSRFAHRLLECGLKPGDKVAMICSNSIEFVIAAYGILKAGMVWVPVNPMLAQEDVRYILEHAEVSMAIMDDLLAGSHRPLCDALGLSLCICSTATLVDAVATDAPTLAASLEGMPDTLPPVVIDEHDLALIMYTSGTTGRPKGVMHSHHSVYCALMSSVATLGIQSSDSVSCLLPLFHCAQFGILAAALLAGAKLVIQRGFDSNALIDAIASERMTLMTGLPLMYAALLAHPLRAQRDLSSLRLCIYAMAPMPEPLLKRLIEEVCPNFALATGQTEIFPMTQFFAPDQQLRRTGNCWGQPSLVNETAVMDENGNLLGPGEIGEIVHRGPNIMLGYYKDPEATAMARRFGWHHTGDLGMWGGDGHLEFKDRIKDMIKTGGENVPSLKVEEVLLRHSAVANAAVVGLPHPHWVEAVTAFVCLKPGMQCEPETLREHCREYLAGFEVPKHIVVQGTLPMTATGKIQKHRLRIDHIGLFSTPVPR